MNTKHLCILFCCAGAGLCLAATPQAQHGAREGIDEARAVLQKWVETRRILSQEARDWTLGREMLESRIELVQREIDSLRGKLNDAQSSIAEADKKREELLLDNQNAKGFGESALAALLGLETRTTHLLARLPDPIRERVRPLSQRFPREAAATKLSLAERFQNVVGVLNEVDKFQREISVNSEVHPLAGGGPAEVSALYIGIGQAYFVDAQANLACVGSSSEKGFSWSPAPQAAAATAKAIAILRNEAPAEFVPLPITID
jgi:hypothetical protein